MSSRNAYLSPEDRKKATVLNRSLVKAKELFDSGEKKTYNIVQTVKKSIESVEGVSVQYVEIRDAETLERVEIVSRPVVIVVAAMVGSVRLIDNIIIGR
jgi:pantoate--beta-alanine ligase